MVGFKPVSVRFKPVSERFKPVSEPVVHPSLSSGVDLRNPETGHPIVDGFNTFGNDRMAGMYDILNDRMAGMERYTLVLSLFPFRLV